LMVLALAILAGGAAVARFHRRRKWWLKIHRLLGTAGPLAVFFGLISAYAAIELIGGLQFAVPHAWFGLLVIAIVLITQSAGLMQFTVPARAALLRSLHRWMGRASLVLMTFAMSSGMYLFFYS